jgi:competence ComEA-like helix-hairpin-helix protein
MKPSFFSSYFQFSKSQRAGIFIFLSFALVFQVFYFWIDFKPTTKVNQVQEKQWLSTITTSDTNAAYSKKKRYVMRPFNPNFITDFKGYQLGMSVEEIDRLLAFRKSNRFVNSAEEFQKVTKVSDSLLNRISPRFKFPEWVSRGYAKKSKIFTSSAKEVKTPIDINKATAEDLKKIYGIGDGLSARILKERTRMGGFVSMDQLVDVWGLSDEVIVSLREEFVVKELPNFQRININTATIKELTQLPYFKYVLARNIVAYRSMNGQFKNIEDLTKISGFPVDRIKIIALYLEF